MSQHDLFFFFNQAFQQIQSEYDRISKSTKEDPGTAGDEGESNWKKIIEDWLPQSFTVTTKGRILFSDGSTSPQVDVIVLKPGYPRGLINAGSKKYLADGVAAVFEVKTTLKKQDLEKIFETSKKIKLGLQFEKKENLYTALHSKIIYGVLAHRTNIKLDILNKAIDKYDKQIIQRPLEMLDLICVASLGTWKAMKFSYIGAKLLPIGVPDPYNGQEFAATYYVLDSTSEQTFTPIGSLICDLTHRLGWQHSELRDITRYYVKVPTSEESTVPYQRQWNLSTIYSESILTGINNKRFVHGVPFDPWMIYF